MGFPKDQFWVLYFSFYIHLKEAFKKQFIQMKAEVNALYNVIRIKDETIGKLQEEVGELKQSVNFLTDETSVIRGELKSNKIQIESYNKKHEEVVSKTVDLEDCSCRNNLVFFNIPEVVDENSNRNENCEEKIINLIEEKQFFSSDYEIFIDRAHRLGPKNKQANSRPRPIIVRFSFYKDKQRIIQNTKKLKGTKIGVSEDFSKTTLEEHRHLVKHAKDAKEFKFEDPKKGILHFKTTYKRVVVIYTTDKTNPNATTFTKSFTLPYILQNPHWYIPQERPSTRM